VRLEVLWDSWSWERSSPLDTVYSGGSFGLPFFDNFCIRLRPMGTNALMAAAARGHLECIEELVAVEDIQANGKLSTVTLHWCLHKMERTRSRHFVRDRVSS
jgi:hypothetical protein